MNKGRYALSLALVLLLQAVAFSWLRIFSARMNLALVFCIALAFRYGEKWGGYTGLFLGLMEDIMFAQVLGIRALLYFLAGFFVGRFVFRSKQHLPIGIFVSFLITFFFSIGHAFICYLLAMPGIPISYFKGPLFLEALFNGLLFIPIHFFVHRYLQPNSMNKYLTYR